MQEGFVFGVCTERDRVIVIVSKVVKLAVKVAFKIHTWLVKTHFHNTPRKRWEKTREEGERENKTKPWSEKN